MIDLFHCVDGPDKPEAKEFGELAVFYTKVCKHDNVVQMLYCQTTRLPKYLILDAYSPGNLLHFLWTLRNVTQSNCITPDHT